MIDYRYSYFIGTLVMLGIWLFLFFIRKDTRREILILSSVFSLGGFLEIVYVRDWWRPLTLTGQVLGIENFLFCFSFVGIAAVIYEDLFKKNLRQIRATKKAKKIQTIKSFSIVILGIAIFLVLVYVFNINTLIATVLGVIPIIALIWYERPDLVLDSIATGIFSVIIMMFVFNVINLFTPGFVYEFWLFQNVPPVLILGVPIDDLIFYLVGGAFIGPIFEYWQEKKLV